jgi:hypothetical protein
MMPDTVDDMLERLKIILLMNRPENCYIVIYGKK